MKKETQPKWPKLLVIVRHGESEQNVVTDLLEKDLIHNLGELEKIRNMDIRLTTKGIRQAKKAGKYLSKKFNRFDMCFCSPYKRTKQTSKAIISKLPYKLKIHYDNRLREKEFGRFSHIPKKQIKISYPEEWKDRKREGKYWYRLPRGENYPDVEMRVHSFLDKLIRDCRQKNILIVTHQVTYKSFRTLFQHLSEKQVLNLPKTPNCGIQVYELETKKSKTGRMKLKLYDKVVHR